MDKTLLIGVALMLVIFGLGAIIYKISDLIIKENSKKKKLVGIGRVDAKMETKKESTKQEPEKKCVNCGNKIGFFTYEGYDIKGNLLCWECWKQLDKDERRVMYDISSQEQYNKNKLELRNRLRLLQLESKKQKEQEKSDKIETKLVKLNLSCISCGSNTSFNEKFCRNCGRKIKENYKFCLNCNKGYDNKEKFCEECGGKLVHKNVIIKNIKGDLNEKTPAEDKRICHKCGKKIRLMDMFDYSPDKKQIYHSSCYKKIYGEYSNEG